MKKIVFTVLAAAALMACQSNNKQNQMADESEAIEIVGADSTGMMDIFAYEGVVPSESGKGDSIDYMILRRMGFRDILALDVVLRYIFAFLMFFFPSFISGTFIKIVAIIILVLSVVYMALIIFSYRNKKEEIVVEYEEKD